MIKGYLVGIDSVVGARRSVARIGEAIGAAETAVSKSPSSTTTFLRDIGASEYDVRDGVGTVGGAVIGYLIVRKSHPVLGVIGGASLGRNVPALLDPSTRKVALRNLATTGSGVAGSLVFKSHPIIGFVIGSIAGGAAAYFGGLR